MLDTLLVSRLPSDSRQLSKRYNESYLLFFSNLDSLFTEIEKHQIKLRARLPLIHRLWTESKLATERTLETPLESDMNDFRKQFHDNYLRSLAALEMFLNAIRSGQVGVRRHFMSIYVAWRATTTTLQEMKTYWDEAESRDSQIRSRRASRNAPARN